MHIKIEKTKEYLGAKASSIGAQAIRDAIANNGIANIILATGASQFEMLNHLAKEKDIDWSKVKSMWCKYGTLEIETEDGDIHQVSYSFQGEVDYKWPIDLKLLNDDYDILWEE